MRRRRLGPHRAQHEVGGSAEDRGLRDGVRLPIQGADGRAGDDQQRLWAPRPCDEGRHDAQHHGIVRIDIIGADFESSTRRRASEIAAAHQCVCVCVESQTQFSAQFLGTKCLLDHSTHSVNASTAPPRYRAFSRLPYITNPRRLEFSTTLPPPNQLLHTPRRKAMQTFRSWIRGEGSGAAMRTVVALDPLFAALSSAAFGVVPAEVPYCSQHVRLMAGGVDCERRLGEPWACRGPARCSPAGGRGGRVAGPRSDHRDFTTKMGPARGIDSGPPAAPDVLRGAPQ